jgi:hypothetical protein
MNHEIVIRQSAGVVSVAFPAEPALSAEIGCSG